MRELTSLLGAAALLFGWGVLSTRGPAPILGFARVFEWLPLVSSGIALASVGVLVALARRYQRMTSAVTLALVGSVFVLPFLHELTLEWLSEVRVGSFGDYVWGLAPTDLYGPHFQGFWQHVVLISAAFAGAAVLLARAVVAVLNRPRGRTFVAGASFALVALAASHGVTRPPLGRWLDALPVVAQVAVDDIPPTDGVRLPGDVRVWRQTGNDDPEHVRLHVEAPALPDDHGGWFPQEGSRLWCGRDARLTLRRVPRENLLLLACGSDPSAQVLGQPSTWERGGVIEVHYWEFKLRNLHVLAYSAPPLAWTVAAAGALLLALGAAWAARRRERATAGEALAHPYRARPLPPRDEASDARTSVLLHAAAMVALVHASAPLVITTWFEVLR